MSSVPYQPSSDIWNPPPEVLEAGNRSTAPYNAYRRVQAGEESQLPVWGSTRAFKNTLLSFFSGFSSAGLERRPRKPNTVGRIRDPHEEGRAIDFMTRDSRLGDSLANFLVKHAEQLGVQLVMWRGTEWSASPWGSKWELIQGNQHRDHVHVELSYPSRDWSEQEMEQRIRNAINHDQQSHSTNQETSNQETANIDVHKPIQIFENSYTTSPENSKIEEGNPQEEDPNRNLKATIFITSGVAFFALLGFVYYRNRNQK